MKKARWKVASDRIQKWAEQLICLMYPPRCPICDKVLRVEEYKDRSQTGGMICRKCMSELHYIGEDVCSKCGKPREDSREEYCYDCKKKKHFFEQGRAVWRYQGVMKASLYRFKYSNRREYARFYARETARLYGEWIRRRNIEVIIPIPLHPKKKRMRGYNQAEVYAKELGRCLGIPVRTDVLERVVYTDPQKELGAKERIKNLKKSLKIRQNMLQSQYILLVDDIYTTGSTMDAAAEAFSEKPDCRIYFLTIAIGKGY